jgi:putative tricarboxylic transport membrane protein
MLKILKSKQRLLMTAAIMSGFLGASSAQADIDSIHFLIPGGAGGGWDGTARGTGEALTNSGLIDNASYENMSGGGGGKAIAHLIETADQAEGTLMVNSTPIVIRSLTKVFPQSFRDVTPIAATIGDFGAFVVRADSKYQNFSDVVADYNDDPRSVLIAGGSARGSMDHLVAAMAFKAAGANPNSVKYLAFDGGGKAMASLLSGESGLLSTGFSEALALADAGEVRILVMTGSERSDAAPDVQTLTEQGFDATFVNWRGFFGVPGLSEAKADEYAQTLAQMYDTPEWETVRARNGWAENFKPRGEFVTFLEEQEGVIGDLMRELGFL